MVGGYSRLFDLIQSQYNWTDEEVLNLHLCRALQIMEVIERRKKDERLHNQTITEWQTRSLAVFIAASSMSPSKKLIAEAQKLSLDLEDSKGKSDKHTPPEVFVEQGSQVALNAPGSYERLVAGFGGLPGPRP